MKQRLIPKGQSGLSTTPFTYQDFISLLDPKTQKIIQDKAIADEAIVTNPTIQTSLKDKPLSPNDPVGEFYVGTAAGKILEYPIKLIGKAALYGLGRLGNKWARAKLISGALNSSPLKYYGTVKYYGPTMGKTTAAKTNHDIVDFDSYARQATEELAKKHGLTKQLLQISPRLELEYKNMLLGLMEKWRTDPNNAFKTLVVSKKVLANEPIYSNIPSIPDRATFLKRLALRGERFPFRSDDYYDALKSTNPNLKVNNNFVSDLEYNPHYINVELLPTIIGENVPIKIVQQKTATSQITPENAAIITPEQWTAAQDAAIARGDMVEAQRLRDLHFKVNAPNTVASVNGRPLQLYHGTNATFNAFDISKYRSTDGGTFGRGVYTTPVKEYAELYGENIMPLYMKLDNPRDYRNSSIGDLIAEKLAFGDDFATGNGIDGAIGRPSWKGFKGLEEYISHNPKNIKSSLPVTYDDNGVRIPLGKRDNFKLNDIRWGLLPFAGIIGTLKSKTK